MWQARHARASDQLLAWEGQAGPRSVEFFHWAEANPGARAQDFVAAHPGWQDLAELTYRHPRAANELLDWARRHPAAADDLAEDGGALRFAARRNAC